MDSPVYGQLTIAKHNLVQFIPICWLANQSSSNRYKSNSVSGQPVQAYIAQFTKLQVQLSITDPEPILCIKFITGLFPSPVGKELRTFFTHRGFNVLQW